MPLQCGIFVLGSTYSSGINSRVLYITYLSKQHTMWLLAIGPIALIVGVR